MGKVGLLGGGPCPLLFPLSPPPSSPPSLVSLCEVGAASLLHIMAV